MFFLPSFLISCVTPCSKTRILFPGRGKSRYCFDSTRKLIIFKRSEKKSFGGTLSPSFLFEYIHHSHYDSSRLLVIKIDACIHVGGFAFLVCSHQTFLPESACNKRLFIYLKCSKKNNAAAVSFLFISRCLPVITIIPFFLLIIITIYYSLTGFDSLCSLVFFRRNPSEHFVPSQVATKLKYYLGKHIVHINNNIMQ